MYAEYEAKTLPNNKLAKHGIYKTNTLAGIIIVIVVGTTFLILIFLQFSELKTMFKRLDCIKIVKYGSNAHVLPAGADKYPL